MKNKIISRIYGGLGNQLFCYAAARRLSLINNAELVIDNISGFAYDVDYKRHYQLDHFNIPCRNATLAELMVPMQRVRRYIKRKWNQQLPYALRSYITMDDIDFDSRLVQFKPFGTIYLDGYWQSENYFKDIEDTLRLDLKIKPPSNAANIDMAAKIRKCTAVAVHIRFFDEPMANGNNNASGDYYRRAIEIIECHSPGAHYFVFSDQPEAARSIIPMPDSRVTLVAHNKGDELAHADLWLMTLCQHFITANSTFSWWGAWLAESSHSVIVAPGFEKRDGISSWGFNGLLPERWVKV